FFQDRADHLARAAPLGPEVDEHRFVGALDVVVERCVAERGNAVGHNRKMPPWSFHRNRTEARWTEWMLAERLVTASGQWPWASSQRSASMAAVQPLPAAVIAWR